MSTCRHYKIGDLGKVVTGKTPPSIQPELLTGKIPFITPGDMSDDARNISTERFVSGAWDPRGRLMLPEASVCVVCIGMTIGKVCMTSRPSHTNQQINSIIVDAEQFDPRFIFYSMRTLAGEIRVRATGAQTRIVNKSVFSNIVVSVPPLETQRRIASILGAYDDLIAVNLRRIAVLEEMARGLFEEWFVRFHFPGHEADLIENASNDSLPQGWSWGSASDLIAFDPRTHVPRDGLKSFVSMGHLDTATSLIMPPEKREGNSGAKFRNGDTLFARITPCLENGKTGLVRGLPGPNGIGFGSTEFIVMRGEAAGPAFTYCLARNASFRDNARSSMSGATGRQRARTESLASFEMPIPSLELLRRFDAVAWPMLELVGDLGAANANLAVARDLLLPRLISGQLSLTQAERELEAA